MSLKLFLLTCLVAGTFAGIPVRPRLGFPFSGIGGRILGGHDAREGQFPHQVSLQWRNAFFKDMHYCGGTILSDRWILTAGHCAQVLSAHGRTVVKAGKHDVQKSEATEQVREIEDSFIHELYPGSVAPYDIALIKLERPLDLNDRVSAARLPPAGGEHSGDFILSGWGSISPDGRNMPNILQTGVLPSMDLKSCNESILHFIDQSPLHESNICTDPSGGTFACNADSGGPLISLQKAQEPAEVIGVVSWGFAPCGIAKGPSVFVKVSAFIDWIEDKMLKN